MKKTKPKKPPVWSHKATTRCSVAIRELLAARKKYAVILKKMALLQSIIIQEGGGMDVAQKVRAAIRHQSGSVKYRRVTTKERSYVIFLELPRSNNE